jgi:lipoate-protein ligase A
LTWDVRRRRGAPAGLFDQEWPAARTAWVLEPTGTAVVLGSTQPDSVLLPGTPAVRRRSGGGAVLVEPGGLVWVDVFVPAGDPLWEVDVGRAFAWLGAVWAAALGESARAGHPTPGAVRAHAGALITTRWSKLVCFAGLGPGEVTIDGAKVVGMAQRRTRAGALFQCAALLEWHPQSLLERLVLTGEQRRRGAEELAGVARGLDVDAGALTAEFLDRLP